MVTNKQLGELRASLLMEKQTFATKTKTQCIVMFEYLRRSQMLLKVESDLPFGRKIDLKKRKHLKTAFSR